MAHSGEGIERHGLRAAREYRTPVPALASSGLELLEARRQLERDHGGRHGRVLHERRLAREEPGVRALELEQRLTGVPHDVGDRAERASLRVDRSEEHTSEL